MYLNKLKLIQETRQLIFWFMRENCPIKAITLLNLGCAASFGVELSGPPPAISVLETLAWQLGVLVKLPYKINQCFRYSSTLKYALSQGLFFWLRDNNVMDMSPIFI